MFGPLRRRWKLIAGALLAMLAVFIAAFAGLWARTETPANATSPTAKPIVPAEVATSIPVKAETPKAPPAARSDPLTKYYRYELSAAAENIEAQKWDAAATHLLAALALQPGDAKTLHRLGEVRQQQGRPEDAQECWRRAAAIDPKLPAPAASHEAQASESSPALLGQVWNEETSLAPVAEALESLLTAHVGRQRAGQALLRMAWPMALHDDARLRQPALAARLAQRARTLGGVDAELLARVLSATAKGDLGAPPREIFETPFEPNRDSSVGGAPAALAWLLVETSRGAAVGEPNLAAAALKVDPSYRPAHLSLAPQLLKKGDAAAVGHLLEALWRQPDDPWSWYQLGVARRLQGRAWETVRSFGEANRLDPHNNAVANELAWLLATHRDPQIHDAARAVALAERVRDRETAPQAETLDTLAAAYAAAGRFHEAVMAIDQALAALPTASDADHAAKRRQAFDGRRAFYVNHRPFFGDHLAHIELGQQLLQEGHLAPAETQFTAAASAAANDPLAVYLLGVVRRRQGHEAEAAELFRRGLKIRPDWRELTNELSWLLVTAEDAAVRNPVEAVSLMETVANAQPTAAYVDTLAAAYAAVGKRAEALKAIDHARQLAASEPNRAELEKQIDRRRALYAAGLSYRNPAQSHADLARLALADDELDVARREAVEAVRREPQQPAWHALVAVIARRRGDIAAAVESYDRALAVRPDWPLAMNELAWLLATTSDAGARNPARAIELAERLVKSHPSPAHQDTLAAAYAAAGRFDDALRTVDAALARDIKLSEASTLTEAQRAQLLAHRGQYAERRALMLASGETK